MSFAEHRCGRVAMMGPPNAGKSTLMNSLLGQKIAIVTPKPQTTRNQIVGIFTDKDAQVIFVDTPGLHQLHGKMNRLLLQAAWQSLEGADMVMVVLDGNQYVRNPESLATDIEPLKEAIAHETRPVTVIFNKVDMFADKSKMLPILEELSDMWPEAEIFPISALNKDGVQKLLNHIKEKMPAGDSIYPEDQISTQPLKFMAAELIREQLFLRLRQELPYTTAVEVEQWKEVPEKNRVDISAVIHVARSSHKGMIIGKQGQNLKEIGTNARKDIEKLVECKVFLELWVRVTEEWMDDDRFMFDIGMGRQN